MLQQITYFKMLVNSILTYLVINPDCAVFLGQRWELHQLLIPVRSQTSNTHNLGFSSLAGGALLVQPTAPGKAGNYFFSCASSAF